MVTVRMKSKSVLYMKSLQHTVNAVIDTAVMTCSDLYTIISCKYPGLANWLLEYTKTAVWGGLIQSS